MSDVTPERGPEGLDDGTQEARPNPSERRGSGRWPTVALASLTAAGLVAFFGSRFLTPSCEGDGCPSLEAVHEYRPPEPPRIYDAEGELVGQLSGPRRIVVEGSAIPEVIRQGYIAVEDRRFRDHGGVDLTGAMRAFVVNLRSGGIAEGGSTITMQLARNVFGPDVLSWNRFRRKLAEIRLARRIEAQLSKDQILDLYLNQIYLGDGVYGVETAAQHYFGKPVAQVGTREAALLIGLAKNPEGYNPRRDPYAAHDRIETVLDILVRERVVSAEEAERARAERVQLTDESSTREWGKNAYYLSAVRRELREIIPEPGRRQGLRVHTGLDPRAQAAAVDALVEQIQAIERGRWGAFRHETPDGELTRMETSPYLQGMVVAMDLASGLVTTLVGGRDYDHSEFDRAFQARRQPGSAFKPIVFAAALERGVRLSDRVSTAPVRLEQRGTPDWEPGDHVSATELTVRNALVQSSNTATVRIGQNVGVERVASRARQLGIQSDIPSYPSVLLGAAEVAPAELVAAYAPFGNGGHRVEPHFITRIEAPDGRVVYQRASSRSSRVLDPRVAFLVLDAMRDVVRRGTGWRVGSSGLGIAAAGKTGTTNDSRDVWFVGMTQRLVAGVWLGFDDPRTIVRNGSGGDLAAPVWARVMGVANRGRKAVASWEPPPGIVTVSIDARTGYRTTPGCPVAEVREEYFLSGSEPFGGCSQMDDPWAWNGQDSLNPVYRYEPEPDTLLERLRRERQRYLDSLDALRARPDSGLYPWPQPSDTVRVPRSPTIRIPPPDTVRVPGGGPPVAPRPSPDTTQSAATPSGTSASPLARPPMASQRSASSAAMQPLPAAVMAWR